MDSIISCNQSAFILGRSISDNIMIAHEILHSLNKFRKRKKGKMAVKLDMSKAYNRVEWPFIEAVMKALGFQDKWI